MNRSFWACFLLVIVSVALGCGEKGSAPKKASSEAGGRLILSEEAKAKDAWPDADLHKAFMRYWEAALDGHFEDCYLQEADYVRQLVPQGKYVKLMEFTTDANKVTGFEVRAPRARSAYLYEVPLKMKMPGPVQGIPSPGRVDAWVKTDSGWFHAVKASLLFPELGLASAMPGHAGSSFEGKEVRRAD